MKVVASEFTTDKATDFSSILTNIRASKADAVFYGGYSPQGGPLLKQMRALGISAHCWAVTASALPKQPTCRKSLAT